MFEAIDGEENSSWGLFLAQLVFAPLVTVVIGTLFVSPVPHAIRVLGPVCCGFALGYSVGYRLPSASRTAQWVWVLPTGIFLFAFLWYLRVGVSEAFLTLFYDGPNAPELGLGPYMFTYPAVGSCLYTIGAVVASRYRQGKSNE